MSEKKLNSGLFSRRCCGGPMLALSLLCIGLGVMFLLLSAMTLGLVFVAVGASTEALCFVMSRSRCMRKPTQHGALG